MKFFEPLDKWHQTKPGLLVFGLAELALGYAFVSWAIDSGSLLDWFLTFVLVIGGLQNFIRLGLKGLKHNA
jgi:hypothetical protein